MRGNCYVTCEALYHLLGGKAAGWKAMRWEGDTHWFLKNENGTILDPTRSQFANPPDITDYWKAVGSGFLTKAPSRRARELMQRMVWQ